MALGGWLGGIAITAAYLVWFDDRADLGGAMLSVTVLAACQLLALVLHPAQLDAADPALWAYAAAWAGALALGLAGVRVAHADGRYRVVRGPGGVPVEMVVPGLRRAGRRRRHPDRARPGLRSPGGADWNVDPAG